MEFAMGNNAGARRPPVHLLESEYDMVAGLALQSQHRSPAIAAMLFEELDRATLHEPSGLPRDVITLGSTVEFVDERSGQLHRVEIVLPGQANITEGRISILTPMGVALYGLRSNSSIDWPDLHGHERRIRIVKVKQPHDFH
jgi:regulator of nucleoside diphosphate kinase